MFLYDSEGRRELVSPPDNTQAYNTHVIAPSPFSGYYTPPMEPFNHPLLPPQSRSANVALSTAHRGFFLGRINEAGEVSSHYQAPRLPAIPASSWKTSPTSMSLYYEDNGPDFVLPSTTSAQAGAYWHSGHPVENVYLPLHGYYPGPPRYPSAPATNPSQLSLVPSDELVAHPDLFIHPSEVRDTSTAFPAPSNSCFESLVHDRLTPSDIAVWAGLYPPFRREVGSTHIVEASIKRKKSQTTKEFSCAIGCGRSFTTKRRAKDHVKRHCAIKDFPCKFAGCKKAFSVSFDAKRHENVCKAGKAASKSRSNFLY
ncbi:hypothetical protein BDN72DRAFT_592063 [Pluteus cervinus]|uniref:Uncharacterized protein n=1 Tax=Pluteus cervinus TaxID=181527 RepID=A0ACD3AVC3_9AGAR|nr:hypothetical protein BDN72DRAFT_592063 [Pluteus cervinus]